ncbi:hypothetical protein [Rhizobium sp. NZLR11]|uniref:hypothetical protein n=1 Tax=Rhizobium sp. NZLR11 TaxID=2731098 RepID=UPI001C839EFD|nr:hypothetical protein [Rhizobium sp. NZLR11]MBX5206686.1 hypothetical protein [Rhizobium sp. NZLR11]
MALGFLYGGNTNETPESIKRKRDLVRAIMGASNAPRNIGEGLNALGDGIVANVLDRRANAAEKTGTDTATSLFNSIIGTPSATPGATGGAMPTVSSAGNIAPVSSQPGEVYSPFIDTVKTGVTNPFGLAAVAATGQAESGFSPGNANRTWADGKNSAGGVMSWNGPRLQALQAANGGSNGTPQQQAQFFLQENPQLISRLNNAKSVDEAQNLMNNAWAFKGYNQPGNPNAAHRLALANGFLPKFQGQGGGQEVASLDPGAGMPTSGPQNQPLNDLPTLASASPVGKPQFVDPQETTPRAPMQGPTQAAPALPPPTTIPNSPQIAAVPPAAPPQQVAQAAPSMAPQGQFGGVDPRLIQAMSNPFLNEGQRAAVQLLIQQQMQASQQQQEQQTWQSRQNYEQAQRQNDPAYKLGIEESRLKVDQLRNDPGEIKVVDKRLVRTFRDGRVEDITPKDPSNPSGKFRFDGRSVEGQALNGLIDSGQLTEEQAQQLGAGKTITDPSTGAMSFMTPQSVFAGQQPQSQQPPIDLFGDNAPRSPGVDLFGDQGQQPRQPVSPPPAAAAPGQAPVAPAASNGLIPLTAGKPSKQLSESERKNQSLSSVIEPELKVVEDNYDALSDSKNQAYSRLPFSEFVTTPEYQKAANSLQTIVSSYLYSVSGATATPEEVRKQTDILTPRPGESKDSIANKKARVRTMVDAVRQAGSLPALEAPASPPAASDDVTNMPVPEGMDANVWKFVPPEDRRLWLKH